MFTICVNTSCLLLYVPLCLVTFHHKLLFLANSLLKIFRRRIHEIIGKSHLNDGNVLGEDILKVDSFLTHQVDYELMQEIGKVFADAYKDAGITKVVTIEASGIAPALYAAQAMNVPMIFAKKAKNITMTEGILTAEVYSFTKRVTSTVSIASKFLSEDDTVLIVDDFLANGQAAKGLLEIIGQAGAKVAGIGIVIEKSFQTGRQLLEETGVPVTSLARIKEFKDGQVVFMEADA